MHLPAPLPQERYNSFCSVRQLRLKFVTYIEPCVHGESSNIHLISTEHNELAAATCASFGSCPDLHRCDMLSHELLIHSTAAFAQCGRMAGRAVYQCFVQQISCRQVRRLALSQMLQVWRARNQVCTHALLHARSLHGLSCRPDAVCLLPDELFASLCRCRVSWRQ